MASRRLLVEISKILAGAIGLLLGYGQIGYCCKYSTVFASCRNGLFTYSADNNTRLGKFIIQQGTSPTVAEAPKATVKLEPNARERHSRPSTLPERSKSAEQRRASDFRPAFWHNISKAQLEYRMTQLKAYALTSNRQTFVLVATTFRNTRDLAKRQRDSLIEAANVEASGKVVEQESAKITQYRPSGETIAISHSLYIEDSQDPDQQSAAPGFDNPSIVYSSSLTLVLSGDPISTNRPRHLLSRTSKFTEPRRSKSRT
ncbi:hypothetical protein F4823DRAFT_557514 [Ustulina deusta]|nr:hypothetical protein F4823DRAFT_557514 [Ustulina deusta]